MGQTKSPRSAVYKITKSPKEPAPSGPAVIPYLGGSIEPEAPADDILDEPEVLAESEAPVSPLFGLTNAELRKLAEYEGIELPPQATKAEMVAAFGEASE